MTSLMTAEGLEQLRRKEARDKATFRRMAVVVPLVVAIALAFELADILGVPSRSTVATVEALQNSWTLKHGTRCLTRLATGLGPATLHTSGTCREVGWRVGQSARVDAKVFRLTRYVAVFPGRSLFRGGSGSPF